MGTSWRKAFFCQARSDYVMYMHLRGAPYHVCHQLHYLQMLTEKLAKAFLSGGTKQPPHRHKALVVFLRNAQDNDDLRLLCDFKGKEQYRSYLRSFLPLAEKIEQLAPALSPGPNAEYPWKDASGEICTPAEYDFKDFDLQNYPKMQKLIRFVEACLRYLERSDI